MADPNTLHSPEERDKVSAFGRRSTAIGGNVGHSVIATGDNVNIYCSHPGGGEEAAAQRPKPLGPPDAPNPYFIGRDDILRELHRAFTEGDHPAVIQAVHGLGGMGKTQIAVEYAHRHREHYQAILWIRAADPAVLVADFARSALGLGLIGQPSANVAEDARWTLSELNGLAPRLLILDNAPNEEAVKAWIPVSGNCRTLITSLFTSWSPTVRAIEVGVLEQAAARAFFLRRLGLADNEANQQGADVLAEELGRLPLALEQAAAFIKETSVSFDRYLGYLREARSRRDLLARRVLGSTQYPESVATTWLATMRRLEPLASAVLDFAAFLAPDAIPRDLLWKARDLLRQGLAQSTKPAGREDVEITLFALDQALGQLHRYSMIRLGAEAFSIHRLLQAVVRDEMDDSGQRAWAERAVLTVNRSFPEIEFKNWGSCERLLPHAKITTTLVAKWSFVFPEAAHLLNKTGFYLSERGSYAAAEPLLCQAVEIFRKAVGEDHPDFANSLNNLGVLYTDQGKFAAAERLLRQAVQIYGQLPGECCPQLAISLNNLSLLYFAQGNHTAAEPLCHQALEVSRKVLDEDHPHLAISLNNLAGVYREQDNYTAAEPLFRQALEVNRKALGERHPSFAAGLNNLALLYHYQRNHAAAEPLYRQSLEVGRQALGENHPDFAISLENFAKLLRATGRLEEAEPLENQANAIRRRYTERQGQ